MARGLTQVGWGGDLRGYIITTLIHGRPGSDNVWPNSEGMVAWSQTGGRATFDKTRLKTLAAYILNWDKGAGWTFEDYIAVAQYGKPLADGSLAKRTAATPGRR